MICGLSNQNQISTLQVYTQVNQCEDKCVLRTYYIYLQKMEVRSTRDTVKPKVATVDLYLATKLKLQIRSPKSKQYTVLWQKP